ncbi:hypothetical protein [Phenylobacterium sp.]|uniref:hypothetical protein n=1 Tax=Phenylobacterium sp. TaxID=1871053 RepID=UPI00289A8F6A|nr:hypothetical protein [Phenylobacterium sp.]
MRPHQPTATDGYAAVDALVAMTILASTIAASLTAAHQGQRIAQASLEVRQATALMQDLLDGAGDLAGVDEGRSAQFVWRRVVDESAQAAGVATLCKHSVLVTHRVTGRVYRAATERVCAGEVAP